VIDKICRYGNGELASELLAAETLQGISLSISTCIKPAASQ